MAQITLTRVATITNPVAYFSGNQRLYLYYGFGAPTGVQPVTVTASTSVQAAIAAMSFTGVDSSGLDTSFSQATSANSTSFSQAFTTVTNNAWGAMMTMDDNGGTPTGVSSTTVRLTGSDIYGFSKGPLSIGANTMDFSFTSSRMFLNIGVAFKPNGTIAFDNAAVLANFPTFTTSTNNFTVSATANNVILIAIYQGFGGGDPAANADVITSVKVGTAPVLDTKASGFIPNMFNF